MFEREYVLSAFRHAMGVQLEEEDRGALARLIARYPFLPRIENYASPRHAVDRFGGRFRVRIYLDGELGMRRFRDDGLTRELPERGPGGYQVGAMAARANVEVMFWGDSDEIAPEARATWDSLTSCLRGL